MKSVRLLRVSWLESSKTKQNNLSSTFATVTSVLAGTVIPIYRGEAVPRLGGDEARLPWLCLRVPALFLPAPQGPAASVPGSDRCQNLSPGARRPAQAPRRAARPRAAIGLVRQPPRVAARAVVGSGGPPRPRGVAP